MEKITSKMDSVFDDVVDSVTDFDVMFDEDDHLVDVVEGFASNGKPLTGDEFEDIHLSDDEKGDPDSTFDLDDDCDPNDIKDTLGDKDDLFGASLKDVENGSECDIDNNNKDFKIEEKDKAEKWFEDSDKEYQDSDFHGSVDPENINKSLEAQREAAAFLESDEEEPEDDEEEDDKSLNDSFDWLSEDTVHDDIDSTSDIMDKDPKDHFDLEDEDDPVSRKDDTETDDGVGELDEFASFLESDEEEPEDDKKDVKEGKDESEDEEDLEPKDESFDWFSENDEGMLADNDEADVHSDVQCDGTENCNCPMCKEKKLHDSELAVGDTFAQEAKAFLEDDTETDITEEEADLDSEEPIKNECGDDPAKAFTDREQYEVEAEAFLDAPDVTDPVTEAKDEDEDLVDPVEDLEDFIVDDADDLP